MAPPDPQTIWRRLGGSGDPPSLLGKYKGTLLILGAAACVWDDFARVRPWSGAIMAVNDIGSHVHDEVAHWATLHPLYAHGWKHYRQAHLFGAQAAKMHAHEWRPDVDCVWSLGNPGETSGLFACFVALMLGYEEITLAGIPADNQPHYFDPPWQRASGADPRISFSVWAWARDEIFRGRVLSLSGNTKGWLGEPLWAW